MLRNRLASTAGLILAGLPFMATPAAAQAVKTAEAGGLTVSEVIVTAQRREESLQKVPVSVAVLTGQDLTALQVKSAFDLQFFVPNLTVGTTQTGGSLAQTYSIRGQSQAADFAPSGVVVYLDEVPVDTREVSLSNYDMASVQVLEGPQGTLFGRNTNGGAVLFTPNRPTHTFGGYITGQYGAYNDGYGEAMLNLPMGEMLAVRIAGNIERRDGYTRNIGGPAEDNLSYGTWRVGVDFKPSSRFDSYTLVNGESADDRAPGWVLTEVSPCLGPSQNASCFFNKFGLLNPFAFFPNPNPYLAMGLVDLEDAFAEQQALGNRRVDNPLPSREHERGVGVANTTTFDLGPVFGSGDVSVKNIIGYHALNTRNFNNFTGTIDQALSVGSATRTRTFTEEFQVLGHTGGDVFRWLVGVFYSHETQSPYSDTDPSLASNTGYVVSPFLFDETEFFHQTLNSVAVYGQGTVDLSHMVHGLSFTAGYRYTWDTPSLTEQIFQIYSPFNVLEVPPGQYCALAPSANPNVMVDLADCVLTAHARFSAPNWNLSLNEQVNDHLMLYLASRHGYKSGGFNTETVDPDFFTFGSEKLTDIEPGFKSDFMLGSMAVRLNADVFYDWYKNLQLSNTVFFDGQPASIIENTGPDGLPSRAHIYGGELSLVVLPAKSMTIAFNYGYTRGVYDHFLELTADGTIQNLSGTAFTGLPVHTLSLADTWRLPLNSEWGEISLTGGWSYRSSYNLSLDGLAASQVAAYSLFDARLDWKRIAGKPIDASVFVKNIGNYTYPLGFVNAGAFGFLSRYYGEPRTWGVALTWHFGG
jgi:iron complex outermembrane receptor protein